MGVCVNGGTVRDCNTPKVGGSNFLYLADKVGILSRTLDALGEVSAYTMDTGEVFYKFEFAPDQSSFVETREESGAITQVYTFVLEARDQAKRNIIQALSDCQCGITVIHGENTGKTWTWGYDDTDEAKLLTNVNDSGTAKTDVNIMTVTLQAVSTVFSREFTGTIPV